MTEGVPSQSATAASRRVRRFKSQTVVSQSVVLRSRALKGLASSACVLVKIHSQKASSSTMLALAELAKDWIPSQKPASAEIPMPRLPSGRLSLNKLAPLDARRLWSKALKLHCFLEDAVSQPVDLWLTDNRRAMVSIRTSPEGRVRLRIHHMFVDAPAPILKDLALLVTSQDPQLRSQAKKSLGRFTEHHTDKIRKFDAPKRRVRIRTEGHVYDLKLLYQKVVREHLSTEPAVKITWGRWGKVGGARKSVRLGSYDMRRGLIRIHPLLDQQSVPEWAVCFVIYHELLHHLYPPIVHRGGRNDLHHATFCRNEQSHPDYERFETWSNTVLSELMSSEAPHAERQGSPKSNMLPKQGSRSKGRKLPTKK